jgi:hypothetical protein
MCVVPSTVSGAAWRDVTEAVRWAYATSQLLLGLCEGREGSLEAGLKRLDMALLMGPPSLRERSNALADMLQGLLDVGAPGEGAGAPHVGTDRGGEGSPGPGSKRQRVEAVGGLPQVPRARQPSLLEFLMRYMRPRVPVVLTGCMDAWPAMGRLPEYAGRCWSDMRYIKKVGLRPLCFEGLTWWVSTDVT